MIFFDIDNTLLDHDHAMIQGAAVFQKEFNHTFTCPPAAFTELWVSLADRAYERYLSEGLSLDDARTWRMQTLFQTANVELAPDEALKMARKAIAAYTAHWRLFPDVKPCLKRLTALSLGIISNGDAAQQREKLDAFGLTSFFSSVHISGDTGTTKPGAAIFRAACRQSGYPASDCTYVGDQLEGDALAAARAGMIGVWINRKGAAGGSADREKVTEINTLTQLPPKVKIPATRPGFGLPCKGLI